MPTLYLTKDEQKAFEKLSAKLKEGWTVEGEAQTAYETPEELYIRANMADFSKFPQVQALVDAFQKGTPPEKLSMENMPEDVFPELCFTVGARGMTAFVRALLGDIKTDEDIQQLQSLAFLRHELLETNSSISYK